MRIRSIRRFGPRLNFTRVLHRRVREGSCSQANASDLASRFCAHIASGLWNLIPVTEGVLRRTSALILSAPPNLFIRIRTADAVHLTTAQEAYFGLSGRSV